MAFVVCSYRSNVRHRGGLATGREELEPTQVLLGARSPFYKFAPIKALKQSLEMEDNKRGLSYKFVTIIKRN
jgi:hypothetical protein